MTNTAKALYQFFSSFGLKAYDSQAVPDEAELPYITYQNVDPRWDMPASVSATVWYSGTSYVDVFSKADEIKKHVGEGMRIPVESGGCVWIYRDTPFAQVQNSGKDNVKAVYLLFGIHALCD